MVPTLEQVIALALQVDPASLHDDSGVDQTPNWDSMQQVVLVNLLEQTFHVTFGPDEILAESTVGRLRAALVRKGAAQ